jgi:hypothetical protein
MMIISSSVKWHLQLRLLSRNPLDLVVGHYGFCYALS